jgi:uncharacterized membrane protein
MSLHDDIADAIWFSAAADRIALRDPYAIATAVLAIPEIARALDWMAAIELAASGVESDLCIIAVTELPT